MPPITKRINSSRKYSNEEKQTEKKKLDVSTFLLFKLFKEINF